jgi:hypothetical protein
MLQQRSIGSVVAAERLVGPAGVRYDSVDDLVDRLRDASSLSAAADASWAGREALTFDAAADDLVSVLRRAVAGRG